MEQRQELVHEDLQLACNKVKRLSCGGSMNHAGFREGGEGREVGGWWEEEGVGGGREVGRGDGGEGGGERGEGYLHESWRIRRRILEDSHESWSLCMGRVSLCYSIAATP